MEAAILSYNGFRYWNDFKVAFSKKTQKTKTFLRIIQK